MDLSTMQPMKEQSQGTGLVRQDNIKGNDGRIIIKKDKKSKKEKKDKKEKRKSEKDKNRVSKNKIDTT